MIGDLRVVGVPECGSLYTSLMVSAPRSPSCNAPVQVPKLGQVVLLKGSIVEKNPFKTTRLSSPDNAMKGPMVL